MVTASPAGQASTTSTSTAAHALPPNTSHAATTNKTAASLRMSVPIHFIAPAAVSARLGTRAMRTPAPLWERLQAPPLRRQGRVGEGCFLGSARTVDTPSQPPPAFAGGGATAKLAAEAAPQDQERDRASGYPREGISNPRRTAGRASPRSSQAATFPKRSNSTSSRAS